STGRSPATVRRYGDVLHDLDRHSAGAEPSAIPRGDLIRFAAAPRTDGGHRSPAGVNLRIAVLKAAFAYLLNEGLLPDNRAATLVAVKQPRRTPDYLSTNEVARLLTYLATRSSSRRLRDLVMTLVFWQTGLRVAEVARLTWGDLDLERHCLRDVLVKGGHRRDVPLNDEVVAVLSGYRVTSANPSFERPIFTGFQGRSLSVRAIQALFATWRAELGWARRLHPHVLRRTHATGALALGVDIATVADLLGHSDLRAVMAYAAVQDGPRRAALRRLGDLVPAEILKQIRGVASAANDAEETTCVEERFDESGAAA
ncbi:MAG TPA: tyrosine-type recombinase/integrase, partial [Polyangiaceae bacterium]|nr:tyrosine-type recombinase/integrase [Polyangiaceae bacterium]